MICPWYSKHTSILLQVPSLSVRRLFSIHCHITGLILHDGSVVFLCFYQYFILIFCSAFRRHLRHHIAPSYFCIELSLHFQYASQISLSAKITNTKNFIADSVIICLNMKTEIQTGIFLLQFEYTAFGLC